MSPNLKEIMSKIFAIEALDGDEYKLFQVTINGRGENLNREELLATLTSEEVSRLYDVLRGALYNRSDAEEKSEEPEQNECVDGCPLCASGLKKESLFSGFFTADDYRSSNLLEPLNSTAERLSNVIIEWLSL